MNAFAMTLDPRRYDVAVKTGRLELVGIAERRLWSYATMRGGVDCVRFYSVDREPFTARYKGHSEREKKITVRFGV